MSEIDRKGTDCLVRDDFKAVYDATHSPRPRRVLSGIVQTACASSSAQFGVKQIERVSRMIDLLSRCILGYVIVDEIDGCNRTTSERAGRETAIVRSSSTWS